MSYQRSSSFRRLYLTILGVAAAIAVIGSVFAAVLSAESAAAPAVAPSNVTEPRITGTTSRRPGSPHVAGYVERHRAHHVRVSVVPVRGSRRGRRVRLRPDLERAENTYTLRQADAGFRIRSQVVARNADGQDTATSNPTNVVMRHGP